MKIDNILVSLRKKVERGVISLRSAAESLYDPDEQPDRRYDYLP